MREIIYYFFFFFFFQFYIPHKLSSQTLLGTRTPGWRPLFYSKSFDALLENLLNYENIYHFHFTKMSVIHAWSLYIKRYIKGPSYKLLMMLGRVSPDSKRIFKGGLLKEEEFHFPREFSGLLEISL
jgi:hypothetical protein